MEGLMLLLISVKPILAQLTQQQQLEQRVPESWVSRLIFTSTDLKKFDEVKLLDK